MRDETERRELSAAEAEALALRVRRIALVGASPDPARPSHGIMRYLLRAGYEVVPVRPGCDEILGRPCAAQLSDVAGPIDLVNVFRRSEAAGEVAREAAQAGAGALWLQTGVRSEEAMRIAAEAGMDFVQDRCIRTVLQRAGR